MPNRDGSWLTGSRVARLALVLGAIHRSPPPGPRREPVPKEIWRISDGPLEELPDLIDLLVDAELVSIQGDRLKLTKVGRHVATQDHHQGGRLLARSLLASGVYATQAQALAAELSADERAVSLVCRRDVATEAAPQLVGLLRRWESVEFTLRLSIPVAVAADLLGVGSQLPPRTSPSADPKKAMGDRGEYYSYLFERANSNRPELVRWIAREDETLGYDIEDASSEPLRQIESKASGGLVTSFVLTKNEKRQAFGNPSTYEIQFWGGVDLSKAETADYNMVRAAGFPKILRDIAEQLADGRLVEVPVQWRVTEKVGSAVGTPKVGGSASGADGAAVGSGEASVDEVDRDPRDAEADDYREVAGPDQHESRSDTEMPSTSPHRPRRGRRSG